MDNKKVSTVIFDYLIILVGSVVYALSVIVFTAPNNIAPGGLTGIGTMLNYLFKLPIGASVVVLNIPLFIWGAIENGKKFLTKTVIATVLCSVMIDVLSYFVSYHYTGDKILASLFGGLISGLGLSLIFYRGGTTGGTDIIARNIHKRMPFVSMGTVILIADIVIIIGASVVYKSIESGLYAVIAIFVSTKVIDTLIYGLAHDNGKLMFVITEKAEDISSAIIDKVGRGVTVLNAQGGYSKDEKDIVMCAVRPSQVHKVRTAATKIDENAFIIVTTANAISGKGFHPTSD